MDIYKDPTRLWNPYVAGVALGLVLFASFVLSGAGLGGSGGINHVAALVDKTVAPNATDRNPYLAKMAGGDANPLNNRMVWMMLGVLLGGFTSELLAGRVRVQTFKGLQIGTRTRWAMAVLGGALMGVGAGLARGCTSGQALSGGAVHIDPAELLKMMYNNQVRLKLLDVRSETDFNVFHLLDAERVAPADLDADWVAKNVTPETVVVVMSNDERAADEAWKRLAVEPNVNAYVLAGGVNRWLDLYRDKQANVPGAQAPVTGDDTLRHRFTASLGERPAVARPDRKELAERSVKSKVKVLGPVRALGGGCG